MGLGILRALGRLGVFRVFRVLGFRVLGFLGFRGGFGLLSKRFFSGFMRVGFRAFEVY